ncbi:MAG: hypothetical protein K8S98_07655 [Planctomycetes bacterium]|nr:hypothetical protein [Planctomycetota bacterium]
MSAGRRDPFVMALVGFFLGLGLGAISVVVRRFFAYEGVAHVVALSGGVAAAFGLVALMRSFRANERDTWRPRATFGLLYATISLLLSVVLCHWLHMQTLMSAADRSQKVVNALYAFRRDAENFPTKLDELVPRYLPELPRPSMRGDPPYEYARDEKGRFELSISLVGTGEGTRLFYRSSNDYPATATVVRAWGYEE